MKEKKLIATGIATSMLLLALTGCGAGGNSGKSAKDTDKGSVYFLNFKSELSSEWEEVAGTFTKETGIDMKVVTAGSGTYEQTLKSELSKKEMPTLFNVNGPIGYQTWKDYCADLKDSKLYEWLTDKDMAITDGDGVYGIPYAVEGYGIIYNDAIMKKYFALPDKAVDISDTKEIKNFDTLKTVVEDMTKHKDDLGIQGVFGSTSFAPGEDWRWQTHLMNIPVYYEYKADGVDNLDEIKFTYNKNFKNIFDLYLNNSCTEPSMVGSKNVEESMAEFATGNVAMIQNGNWGWAMIYDLDGNVVKKEDIKFLPIYTGVEGEENQGLCVGTENYICINNKVSEADQKASEEFLEWLFNSESGKAYCNGILGMIPPFSTFDEDERPDNPLVQDMLSYMNDDSLYSITWDFTTFPSQEFKNQLGSYLLEYAQGNMTWDDVVKQTTDCWASEKALLAQ